MLNEPIRQKNRNRSKIFRFLISFCCEITVQQITTKILTEFQNVCFKFTFDCISLFIVFFVFYLQTINTSCYFASILELLFLARIFLTNISLILNCMINFSICQLRIYFLDFIPCRALSYPPLKSRESCYDTEIYLTVRLKFTKFGECRELLYHYSLVHSDID